MSKELGDRSILVTAATGDRQNRIARLLGIASSREIRRNKEGRPSRAGWYSVIAAVLLAAYVGATQG